MGFDRELHKQPTDMGVGAGGDTLVFVGHREAHTEQYVVTLREAGLPVRVWGAGWQQARDRELRDARIIPQDQYALAIASAGMALCSLSRRNRNESTGRTFEIPAIGSCLLAESTQEHKFLFRDGEQAVLFVNGDDLVRKARYYITNAAQRRAIAIAGHERCLQLDLSWEGHMRREWPIIERMLVTGEAPTRGLDDVPFWPGFRDGEPFGNS